MFFWVLEPYKLAGRCQRFGETYCLHLQGKYFVFLSRTVFYVLLQGRGYSLHRVAAKLQEQPFIRNDMGFDLEVRRSQCAAT
jgi:hypothetical protein